MTTKALFYVIQSRLSENLPTWALADDDLESRRRDGNLTDFVTDPIVVNNHVTTAENTLIDDFMGDGYGALISPRFADLLPRHDGILLHPAQLDSSSDKPLLYFQCYALPQVLDLGGKRRSNLQREPLALKEGIDAAALAKQYPLFRPAERPNVLCIRHDIAQALIDAGLDGFRLFDWMQWKYTDVSSHPYLSWDMMFGYTDEEKCAVYKDHELRPNN